ncbi:hypothetical protein N7489_005017 [Penicillium chrysogenum]|uniref:uncharacterized protein n=1 Tax=Penicillium chrysogenum TaxID=5076 RepID=UPI0024DF2CA0|nr:uncharacterized protein N7489_005017 [Penicillium chrysogenum]KAJ5244921.1 hypothetical protein N7489_005017 [Penicillium chrysogenum]KAJ5849208.1 hypothetical protein N7534_007897 [Penicillium rubens]
MTEGSDGTALQHAAFFQLDNTQHRIIRFDPTCPSMHRSALLRLVEIKRSPLENSRARPKASIQVSGQYHHGVLGSIAEFPEAAVRGKIRKQGDGPVDSAGRSRFSGWRRGTAPCVTQPAETGRPVPCDPENTVSFHGGEVAGPGRARGKGSRRERGRRATHRVIYSRRWGWSAVEGGRPPFGEGVGR